MQSFTIFFLIGKVRKQKGWRELCLGAEGRQGGNMPIGLPERSGDGRER